jgi:hypothetical protein
VEIPAPNPALNRCYSALAWIFKNRKPNPKPTIVKVIDRIAVLKISALIASGSLAIF